MPRLYRPSLGTRPSLFFVYGGQPQFFWKMKDDFHLIFKIEDSPNFGSETQYIFFVMETNLKYY